MFVQLLLFLTLFSSGLVAFENSDYSFGFPWFSFEAPGPDVQRVERGPPPFAGGGHGKHGHGPPPFAHGHGGYGDHGGPYPGNGKKPGRGHGNNGNHGNNEKHGHGHGGHGNYPDCSEEYEDSYEDSRPMRTTKRPHTTEITPLPTRTTPSTTTDYSGMIDVRFKEDTNARKKRSQDLYPRHYGPYSSWNGPEQDSSEDSSTEYTDFNYWGHHHYPRISTCVQKKYQCLPLNECKSPPRDFHNRNYCKFSREGPYVCCEKKKEKTLNQKIKCGKKNGGGEFSQAIIGGSNVAEGSGYPWMVAVGENMGGENIDWYCGGALIGEKTVITAAHCASRRKASVIRIGGVDLSVNITNNDETTVQQISVAKTLVHPLYKYPLLYNDIALLYFENPVTFTNFIRPICLPQKSSISENSIGLLTGWGQLTFASDRSKILQEVTVKVFNNTYCDEQYSVTQSSKRFFPRGILDTQLCAGDEAGGKDACQGDSGAPLVVNEDGNPVLIGTVSAGIGCGSQIFPGVYTRITSFTPWIIENTL